MADLENLALTLALVSILLSLALAVIAFISRRRSVIRPPAPASAGRPTLWRRFAVGMAAVSLLLISLTIGSRIIQTGHGPFSSMYEFAIAFAWGIVVAGLVFRWRYKTDAILNMGLFIAMLLLIFARVKYAAPNPLVPALQQSTLLSIHVASAVVAYGTLTIGFGAAAMYLFQNRRPSPWLPEPELLDTISYRSVVIGFPFLTLVIVLGALWADIAWGRYWGWDPKETASLVTWLIYAAYIHARVMRGWRGVRAAWFLIIGFAAILLTFFGNYIFTGLHAY